MKGPIINIPSDYLVKAKAAGLTHFFRLDDHHIDYAANTPRYFAAGPERERDDFKRLNSGVMIMNLPNMYARDKPFFF